VRAEVEGEKKTVGKSLVHYIPANKNMNQQQKLIPSLRKILLKRF
jgi:hypothetical protein